MQNAVELQIDQFLAGYTAQGQISRLPKRIIRKMLRNQYAQTGSFNVSVFEDHRKTCKEEGGFQWADTPEGYVYWSQVFNEKYPSEHLYMGSRWPIYFNIEDTEGPHNDVKLIVVGSGHTSAQKEDMYHVIFERAVREECAYQHMAHSELVELLDQHNILHPLTTEQSDDHSYDEY